MGEVVGYVIRFGQEEEWWEQTFGGRNAWRMGGGGRNDYCEKLGSEQEALSVGSNSECSDKERKDFVLQHWEGFLAEVRSRGPMWVCLLAQE